MTEMGASLDPSMKSSIETTINSLKQAMESEDIHEIKRLTETLTQASHQMATAAYQQSADSGTQQQGVAPGDAQTDDVVDAEYQEVA